MFAMNESLELRDLKLSLDEETIQWLREGARIHKTSLSGFLRLVPTLLTPGERELIERLRKSPP